MTTFSFHPVKAITSGEGGMVSTDDDVWPTHCGAFAPTAYAAATTARMYARRMALRRRLAWLQLPHHRFPMRPGEHQLARLDEFIAARNRSPIITASCLGEIAGAAAFRRRPASGRHAYHLFVVRFREGAARRKVSLRPSARSGIGVQLHYIPIPGSPLYRSLGYTMEGLHATQAYYEAGALVCRFSRR